MKKIMQRSLVVAVAVLALSGIALADNDQDDCSLKTLRGTYVFAATGHNIVAGVPQPKAIIEVIEFHGDGKLSVPAATRSVNGAIALSTRWHRQIYRRGRVYRHPRVWGHRPDL
jgi:hypothetical protein